MIIHIVNGDSADPIGDFNSINRSLFLDNLLLYSSSFVFRELQLFSPALAQKPQVVVLNKIDLPQVTQ